MRTDSNLRQAGSFLDVVWSSGLLYTNIQNAHAWSRTLYRLAAFPNRCSSLYVLNLGRRTDVSYRPFIGGVSILIPDITGFQARKHTDPGERGYAQCPPSCTVQVTVQHENWGAPPCGREGSERKFTRISTFFLLSSCLSNPSSTASICLSFVYLLTSTNACLSLQNLKILHEAGLLILFGYQRHQQLTLLKFERGHAICYTTGTSPKVRRSHFLSKKSQES